MKNFYLLCTFLLCAYISHSQIANIGDSRLKVAILNTGIDVNNDGEIQLSEASALTSLNANFISARTFQGIEHFTNLTNLNIGSSNSNTDSENIDLRALTNLETLYLSNFSFDINLSGLSNLKVLECNTNPNKIDITGLTSLEEFSYWSFITSGPNYYLNHLTNLKKLDMDGRALTQLDIGNLTNLELLYCGQNQLTELDVSNAPNLSELDCSYNQLTSLDLSHNNISGNIRFYNNPITSLNTKNGSNTTFYVFPTSPSTNLQSVCCDADELAYMQQLLADFGYTGVTFETDCAPTPTGTPYYNIQGKNTLDSNLNGCDAGDGFLPEVEYTVSNGTDTVTIYTDKFGNYEFIGKAGTYTITPTISNTNYYSISTASVTVNLPADGTTVVHDFCITPNGAPIVTSLSPELRDDIIARNNIDTNNDGEIQITEAESVTSLTIKSPIIKGLDNFINLETLSCGPIIDSSNSYNSTYVLYLDVNPLVNLKELNVSGNRLGTLDVSQNTLLEELNCSGNLLNTLILNNNPNLKRLNCGNLGVSNDPISINLNRNTFKTLDLSNNPLLEYVNCSYAAMDALVLGSNTNLKELHCANSNLTSLDVTQLPNLEELNCGIYFRYSNYPIYTSSQSPNQITSLDLSQNPNLWYLNCNGNLLSSLNTAAQGTSLSILYCDDNPLNTINVSQNTSLQFLRCNNTGINTFDASTVPNLRRLSCADNALTSIDISQNPNLTYLDCHNNQITQLFVKNGNTFFSTTIYGETFNEFKYYGNPIEYICADEFELNQMPSSPSIAVNTYCSFVPGGSYNTIQGVVRYDANGNGCDVSDNPYEYLNLNLTNSTNETSTVATENDGTYSFHFSDDGVYTLTPVLENPSYFTITPASITVDFPTDTSPFAQDFCVTPNGVANDLDITLLPLDVARPGFDSNYKLVYKNKGNTTLSGAISLTFEDDFMDLVSSNPMTDSQALNSLQWNYVNLLPFESREILVTMNLNTPTDASFPLNADDTLAFETTITPVVADETMDDNTFTLSQLVVNSFDPNDKNCLQGTEVTTDLVGKYIDYMIRFENTGTANAINVVVKDIINTTMFDVNSIVVTNASHAVVTRIKNTNTVEFIFENINLPFDDASNDGFITFKIKTLPTLIIDDTFENKAEIYFDYNFPIETNTSITLIEDTLSETDIEYANFEMYPNPVENVLVIKTEEIIETVKIYDISGRLIQQTSYANTQNTIEITTEKFTSGTYFVKVNTTSGATLVKKIVKN